MKNPLLRQVRSEPILPAGRQRRRGIAGFGPPLSVTLRR
jgi:hypothetical protein